MLRVDLSTGAITTESMDAYKPYLGGTGMGWKVLWDEVPPGTHAFDAANKLIFATGPITGSGSPSSGRTSVVTLWPVASPELPAAGHFGGHWGPELKYAGYDAIIVQGVSAKPVWLRIEDEKVTLEDASEIWGEGIYRSTNHIVNLMGSDAHVVCIGQAGENLVRMAALFTDRSHRAGGAGGVMGSKRLKAIGVRGTGAVRIAADKAKWKSLNQYFLSLMGANNQCVVARELQPWSEYSPGGTRWSGRPGVLWGSSSPPLDVGTCADVEHPTADAPSPINKIGMRTQKGFNDFGMEGMRRTVRMDGCHACPIRCHIAAEHKELEGYGLTAFNMNTCMGNSGSGSYNNTAGTWTGVNSTSNPMLLAYMANNLEGDYGIWNDYGQWHYAWTWAYRNNVVVDQWNPATIPDPNNPGQTIPNPDLGKPYLQKYLSKQIFKGQAATVAGVPDGTSEWDRLKTVKPAATAYPNPPLTMLDQGDPRWLQWILAEISMPKTNTVYADGNKFPETLGYYMGLGPPRLAQLWPELGAAMDILPSVHQFKMGHTSHHGVETQAWIGALVNAMTAVRDANTHTHQNFFTNGLPNSSAIPLKQQIAQEIATSGNSLFSVPDNSPGEWAWDVDSNLPAAPTPMNLARASIAAQSIVVYELQNSLTCCNYTLPVWASPLKSRNYRGDTTLDAQVFSAVTGQTVTQKDLETMALRNYTLYRALLARYMEYWNPGTGKNMRNNFDQISNWCFKDKGTTTSSAFILPRGELDAAKNLMYQLFGFDQATGLPTSTSLTSLGLDYMIPALQAAGLLPA
ncbi:MAG TPA: aldehyde ferredoxin oxidoreductase N-terminal domain-containing protein [Myxococcales bacterium]|nr:aldehyde ferredoxin oxidoreductase N-terminal domain-containing protein [Myxococcales bacterium]